MLRPVVHESGTSRHYRFGPAGWLTLYPDFLSKAVADRLFERLRRRLDWQQRKIRIFGRQVVQPRLIAWYGEEGVAYTYSGDRLRARGWPPALAGLAPVISRKAGQGFNSVLCNRYRDGRDSMGWHADDERELGENPVIASLSLGQVRRFSLRPRDRSGPPVHLEPESGSLLIMGGDIQHHWHHGVPKTRRPVGERINLTFRTILESVTD